MNNLDDLGVPPGSPGSWANRKSRWRKRTRKVLMRFDAMVGRHNKGLHISMGDLYELARTIAELGDRGVALRVDMPHEVTRRETTGRGLAALCAQLESASRALERVAIRQNTPLVEFPTFVNRLYVSSEVDAGALSALEEMMKEVER